MSEIKVEEDYDSKFVETVLKLPCMEELDPDELYQAIQVATMYLPDARFQAAILDNAQLDLAFGLLKSTSAKLPFFPEDEGECFLAIHYCMGSIMLTLACHRS